LTRLRLVIALAFVIAASALGVATYWLGAYGYAHSRWPASEFKTLRYASLQAMRGLGIDYDVYARLIAYPGKSVIPCPPQTDRTAVFLIIGQSNAANSGGQRYEAQSGHVAAYFDGVCNVAASPLLGTSGTAGEPWSAIGDRLVSTGAFDEVMLIPAAVGGSGLSEWTPGGDLNAMLKRVVEDAQRRYRITHVLWHQGETDFAVHTNEETYVAGVRALGDDLRKWGVTAPIYVSVATRCEPIAPHWTADNPVSRAQRKLASSGPGFAAGVDTDALLGPLDRHDGCHMAGSGLDKAIDAWTEILRAKPGG
jgi:Carbohydrate esterase, sialic acid-specific acetylesterase